MKTKKKNTKRNFIKAKENSNSLITNVKLIRI